MIAAAGRFETRALVAALRAMARNSNPAYDHELRSEGHSLIHDCGWGAAYALGSGLVKLRSASPCFEDHALDAVAHVRPDFMVLHARRTKDRSTISEVNSHPFTARYRDEEWAFCHNGEVRDLSELSHDDALAPEGTIDSERLFLHVLTRIDPSDDVRSLAGILRNIGDFTSLNCFLLRAHSLLAYAGREPSSSRPKYYTLWRGRAHGLDLISSEIVDGFDVEWEEIPDGSAIRLAP